MCTRKSTPLDTLIRVHRGGLHRNAAPSGGKAKQGRDSLRTECDDDGDASERRQGTCQAEGGRLVRVLTGEQLPVRLQLEQQVADVPAGQAAPHAVGRWGGMQGHRTHIACR